jgi:U5 snRNP spliceosome subunit
MFCSLWTPDPSLSLLFSPACAWRGIQKNERKGNFVAMPFYLLIQFLLENSGSLQEYPGRRSPPGTGHTHPKLVPPPTPPSVKIQKCKNPYLIRHFSEKKTLKKPEFQTRAGYPGRRSPPGTEHTSAHATWCVFQGHEWNNEMKNETFHQFHFFPRFFADISGNFANCPYVSSNSNTISANISKNSAKFSSKSSRKRFIFHSANEISFFILQNLMHIFC